jgi:hypothetical protein
MEKIKNKKEKFSFPIYAKVILIISVLLNLFMAKFFFVLNCTEYKENGWFCSYMYPRDISENKRKELEQRCIKDGGDSMVSRAISGGEYFVCSIPFSDYGKPCTNSSECKGDCEYIGAIPTFCVNKEDNVYSCSEKIQGTCSKENYSICSFWKEVNDQQIIHHLPICEY